MNIQEFAQLSLKELQTALLNRETSPLEIIDLALTQIEEVNGTINALYGVRPDEARASAAASDRRYAAGEPIGPFDGVPVTIKDSVNAVGMTWFHGSAVHGSGVVAKHDSPPAKRLKAAGTIILGKGIMPDFGLSASGVSSSHGIVRNPWGTGWNTGGSSAGGAASIAAGIGMMAVGSDIAGSVRLPASHCGLAALKPTQGVIPHAPASTVRSAGPIARKAEDLIAWTKLLSGLDDDDRFSMPYMDVAIGEDIKVGVSADFGFGPVVEPEIVEILNHAAGLLSGMVGSIIDVNKRADFDVYAAIDQSLKLRGWHEYSAAAPDLQSKVPQQLFEWFKEAEYWDAAQVRGIDAEIERGIGFCVELLLDVDVLLTPVMPIVNFPAEERGIDEHMPLRHTTFTAPFNQSGHPAVSICGGFDKRGLPVGIQLVGKRLDDARIVKLAVKLEAALALFGSDKRQWPTTTIS